MPAVRPRVVSVAAAKRFFERKRKYVLAFGGFSGLGYEDPAAVLRSAREVLARFDPAGTIVCIGATADGIGAVYEAASALGFETAGIVSSRALEAGVEFSPFVDHALVVRDALWGGVDPATGELSPTAQAIVACADEFVAIGGGHITADELAAAQRAGKATQFIPADPDDQRCVGQATDRGTIEPTS